MIAAPKCLKCNALAKHDPVGGVMTTCGRHSAANAERAAERMRKRHADPEFAAANAERAAERMRKLNADPEFAAANAERMRKRNADPEFAAAHAERMRKRNADPDHNPLVMLTTQERADYDTFKRNGYSRDDAFRAIGRADLIRPEAAE